MQKDKLSEDEVPQSDVDLATMIMHEMSLDDNPVMAAKGRMLKHIAPAITQATNDEILSASRPFDVFAAHCLIASRTIGVMYKHAFKDHETVEGVDEFIETFIPLLRAEILSGGDNDE